MIILDDTKSLSYLATDNSNGLGTIECINPLVTENLNGGYELEFDVAISEKYYPLLKVGGLLKCKGNQNSGDQIFRIYKIGKAINGVCSIYCQHITYDLSGVVVKPFTATGAVNAKNGMLQNVIGTMPFTMTTDITNTQSTFNLDIPRSFRECLGGYEGSLLDVFRGEYEWDNLTVRMLAHRGADNGVRIAYGKNLTDFTQEENNENVYTGVLGYANIDDVVTVGNIYHKVQSNNPKIKVVDFSSDYESGDTPTVAELNQKAQTYATNNDIEIPNVNIKVSFVPLWQTEEYKNILPLERVSLGDTVHVFFEKLGVEATARVIKTVWNVNLDRYEEIELGDAKANLNSVINETVDSAVENAIGDLDIDTGAIETEMFNMSKLIANGMGLHMSKDSIGRIILHNDEDLTQSQYQYMITANGFMLSDDYGQTWNSGWDISGNAIVNSLATITLKFLEGYGMYMRFGDINSNYIEVSPYSENNVPMGVSFDGSGYVRFQPQEQFIVNNLDSSDHLLNEFVLGSQGTNNQAFITLKNYDYVNHCLANALDMDSRMVDADNRLTNRLNLRNIDTFADAEKLANQLLFDALASRNEIILQNRQKSVDEIANRIYMYGVNSSTSIQIVNKKASSSLTANFIGLYGSPESSGSNETTIANYDPDSDNISNYFTMKKTRASNLIEFQLWRGGSLVGLFDIEKNSSNVVSIKASILDHGGYGYTPCSFELRSDGNIRANGQAFFWNGSQKW